MPILNQGEVPDGVYLVVDGTVEISYRSPEGYEVIIGHSGPTRILGAIEVVAERPCVARCTLHPGASAIVWEPHTVRDALSDPVLRRNFGELSYAVLEYDNTSKVIDQHYSAEQRICRYLGRLAAEGSTFTHSQSYLAAAVGCTRQTVNKELSLLKQRGVIATSKGKIDIIDPEELENRITELGH